MRGEFSPVEHIAGILKKLLKRHSYFVIHLRQKFVIKDEVVHLILASFVGILGGIANLVFHSFEEFIKIYVFHRHGEITEIAELLVWWQRVLVPAFGGLLAGLVLYWGLKIVGKTGPGSFLEVVVAGDGRLPFRPGLIKTLSSLISISSGASIGREGSIVQLSATLASKFGQIFEWQPYTLRLLTACGAASGIAAAYNAPLAGAVFAAQVVLGNFSMNLFGPVVLASLVAAVVSRSFFGIAPLYEVPPFEFVSLGQLPWLVIVGIGSGVLSASFLKGLALSEQIFKKIPGRLCVKMAVGGLAVGALAIGFPWVWGNGYSATNAILHENLSLSFLLSLFLAKIVATMISSGSGAVGGVMTPSLFTGAAWGSFFGSLLHLFGIASDMPICVFSLAGMASVLAGTTHAPLLAMIMVFEISLNYSLMPALMLSCPIATLIAKSLHPVSVYTESLKHKGISISESNKVGSSVVQTVADLMKKPVQPLLETASFQEIVERFLVGSNNFIPVVDSNQRLKGVIALQDVKEYLNNHDGIIGVIAYDIMRPTPVVLTPQQSLLEVFSVVLNSELRNIPVVNNEIEKKLIGSVVRAEALGIISEAISVRTLG